MKKILFGMCLIMSSVSFAQQPAPWGTPSKGAEKKKAPAKAPAKVAPPATSQPAAPVAPPAAEPRVLESQPGSMPGSNPGDTYEQNPVELQQTACELHGMIKAAEAKAGSNETPEARASREALIVAQKRELKGALSVFKKVTRQDLDLESACQ